MRTATPDPALVARVVSRTALRYDAGADPSLDRGDHVRAASSLAWVPGGIALVQDDANFLGVFDPRGRRTRAITLPADAGGVRRFDDGRGNKARKMDLEACLTMEADDGPLLVILGSGSSPERERAILVDRWDAGEPRVHMVHLPALYAALRDAADFSGAELNVEGAVQRGGAVQLFGRGNGARGGGRAPVNATCTLDAAALLAYLRDPDGTPAPRPRDVVQYALGALDGVALGFTDATPWGERLLFTAAAEDSPDAVRDGRVAGSVLGVIPHAGPVRWAPLVDDAGVPLAAKVEGVLPARAAADRVWVVIDADDPDAASELCEVVLEGPWRGSDTGSAPA